MMLHRSSCTGPGKALRPHAVYSEAVKRIAAASSYRICTVMDECLESWQMKSTLISFILKRA